MTTNKTQVGHLVAAKLGLKKNEGVAVTDAVVEVLAELVSAGESVNLPGLGKFEVRDRAARNGRNPQTGEAIEIPATKAPAFKAAQKLKDAVKGQ